MIKPLPIPKRGENLPTSELERVLNKSAEEICEYDYELSNYIIDRIDESLTRTNALAYEVMEGTAYSCSHENLRELCRRRVQGKISTTPSP